MKLLILCVHSSCGLNLYSAGPYLYALYRYHGFVGTQVAVIYACGIVSSAIFMAAKDIISDKLGRRATVVLFCVVYSLSCLLILIPNYGVLLIGRCVAGLSNSILFSTMETWYVHEHINKYDFPKEWVPITFSHVAFGSSIVAVAAGVVADAFARWLSLGPLAPFILAIPALLSSIPALLFVWTENYGEERKFSFNKERKSCLEGLKTIVQNVDLFLVGAIQSLFESVVFVFVFIWTPSLDVFHDVPLGIIFASFMVCNMLGSITCDYLISKVGYSMTRVLVVLNASASIIFIIAAQFARDTNSLFYRIKMLLCLQSFELICGFYFPIMRVLREKFLPAEHKLSVTNWFRVPLTIFSSIALLNFHDTSHGIPQLFVFCAVMMSLAFMASLRFARGSTNNNTAGIVS